jgi:hypothetical protein
MPLFGSGRKWEDAASMGFAGPVKSATTTRQAFMKQPIQPEGPTIIYQLFCVECEFDRNGNEVSSRPGGWLLRRILDSQGRVEEEIKGNEKGEAERLH